MDFGLLPLSWLAPALVAAGLGGCGITQTCDEKVRFTGDIGGLDLASLELDTKGYFLTGTILEPVSKIGGGILTLLSLEDDPSGEDGARMRYLYEPDLVLESSESDVAGGTFQLRYYGLGDAGAPEGATVDIGESIRITDASGLNVPHDTEDDVWQTAFRSLVDRMREREEVQVIAVFEPPRPDGLDDTTPPVFSEGAVFASSGTVRIREGYAELSAPVETISTDSAGPLGKLTPVWYRASLVFEGREIEVDASCARYEEESETD